MIDTVAWVRVEHGRILGTQGQANLLRQRGRRAQQRGERVVGPHIYQRLGIHSRDELAQRVKASS